MGIKLSVKEVRARLARVHGSRIILDPTTYINTKTHATFIDKKHGAWKALPQNILKGQNHPGHYYRGKGTKAYKGLKTCYRCSTTQKIEYFCIDSRMGDGLSNWCKVCHSQYRKENRSHRKQIWQQYFGKHREHKRQQDALYQSTHRVALAKAEKRRHHTNLLYHLASNLRSRLTRKPLTQNWNKTYQSTQCLGCSIFQLKLHLEKQFKSGMTWENYGKGLDKWNIDHIVPLASAHTPQELYKLCHYTNLQPLWAADNFKKGARII